MDAPHPSEYLCPRVVFVTTRLPFRSRLEMRRDCAGMDRQTVNAEMVRRVERIRVSLPGNVAAESTADENAS